MRVKPEVTREQADEFVAFVFKRIGRTRREALAWAVDAVQREPKDMTPGDWDNLRMELVGCIWWGDFAIPPSTSSPTLGAGGWDENGPPRPSQEEAKAMLSRMGAMIAAVIKREHVPVMKVNGTLILRLASIYYTGSEPNWMQTWEDVKFSWPDRAALALASLIEREGLFLKECPAPLPRDEEICGKWFVATRPRQEYCSRACQSRASTRAAREGTETPAAQRRKSREEG